MHGSAMFIVIYILKQGRTHQVNDSIDIGNEKKITLKLVFGLQEVCCELLLVIFSTASSLE